VRGVCSITFDCCTAHATVAPLLPCQKKQTDASSRGYRAATDAHSLARQAPARSTPRRRRESAMHGSNSCTRVASTAASKEVVPSRAGRLLVQHRLGTPGMNARQHGANGAECGAITATSVTANMPRKRTDRRQGRRHGIRCRFIEVHSVGVGPGLAVRGRVVRLPPATVFRVRVPACDVPHEVP